MDMDMDKQTYRFADILGLVKEQMNTKMDKHNDGQKNSQTNIWIGKQTNVQIYRLTNGKKDKKLDRRMD